MICVRHFSNKIKTLSSCLFGVIAEDGNTLKIIRISSINMQKIYCTDEKRKKD